MARFERTLILASASPRRRELLEKLRIPFRVMRPDSKENMRLPVPPRQLVKTLALEKALSVAIRHAEALVIGADTIVVLGGEVLGKPRDLAHARAMLRALSGATHSVLTGVALVDSATGKRIVRVAESKVTFRSLTEREIREYARTEEPLGKAGAYAIQGFGAALVHRVRGDFLNVVGLPLLLVRDELVRFGIQPFSDGS